MSEDIKYDKINKNENVLDIDIVRQIYEINENKNKYIKSDIKKYFSYVIKLLVKQSDLEKRAKNGFKYIKYPIYIDKENYDRNLINKYTKFMTDSCSTEMQQFEHISPIYKKINWLSGPVGLPIYDKYYIYQLFPLLYKYKEELYSKEYKTNVNEIIMESGEYDLYLKCLKELVNVDLENIYQDFNIELTTSSFKVSYYKEQNDYSYRTGYDDVKCTIYYLTIKW